MTDMEEIVGSGGVIKRLIDAVGKAGSSGSRTRVKYDAPNASTAPAVMKHIAHGAGAGSQRSSKGGKSGGGMGGQQAGGIKGGGKRKTHAGRK
jgi:hypothetical protein